MKLKLKPDGFIQTELKAPTSICRNPSGFRLYCDFKTKIIS